MRTPAIQTMYGLSPQQKGMLFQTLAAEPGLFVEQIIFPLDGPLNVEAFRRAWQRIVDRHDVLRTAFVWKQQQEPMQVVLQTAAVALAEHDLRSMSGAEQTQRLAAIAQEERRRPFDVLKPPLMRLAVVRTGEMSHQCVWTQHHVVMDGWCGPILLNELALFYPAFCAGRDAAAPPPPQYKEYIGWLKQQDPVDAERFWRGSLAGIRRPTAPGTEDPHFQPAPQPERWGAATESVGRDRTAALSALARDRRLTLNTLLQGAWALVLSRLSRQDDVVFGVTVSGRPAQLPAVERIIGLFMNTVPCRVPVPRDTPLTEWLIALQAAQAESRRFDYCSTGEIHDWTDVPLTTRLYDSVLVVENYPGGKEREGATGQFVGGRTSYLLTVIIQTGPDLSLTAVYDGARMDRDAAQTVLQQLQSVLHLFLADPESTVGAVLERMPLRIPRIRAERAESSGAAADDRPQTTVEEQLATLCQELLQVPQVPMTASFFALGAHSLLLTRLASRIRYEFDVELPLRTYFEALSLRELAGAIEEAVLRSVEALSEEEAARLAVR